MNDLAKQLFCGGVGCGVAGFVTNPMDVVKTRNQQQGGEKYGSFRRALRSIVADEGASRLLKGARASVLREATYSSFRMGLYEPIKLSVARVTGDANHPLVKWGSAYVSGGLSSAIFNPFDLVKVRFQSAAGALPHNGSIVRALFDIGREPGGAGLYAGVGATVVRAALLTGAQLGSYDVFKNNLLVQRCGFERDAHATHFAASLLASLIATTAANPPDVVKTRAMNDRAGASSYAIFRALLREEGPRAFMKGWTASYTRIGPHTIISFVLIERARQFVGLQTY